MGVPPGARASVGTRPGAVGRPHFPTGGNSRKEWDAGARFDFENPEYRA